MATPLNRESTMRLLVQHSRSSLSAPHAPVRGLQLIPGDDDRPPLDVDQVTPAIARFADDAGAKSGKVNAVARRGTSWLSISRVALGQMCRIFAVVVLASMALGAMPVLRDSAAPARRDLLGIQFEAKVVRVADGDTLEATAW